MKDEIRESLRLRDGTTESKGNGDPKYNLELCPRCEGRGEPIGKAGNEAYFKCRTCGKKFTRTEQDPTEGVDDLGDFLGKDAPQQPPQPVGDITDQVRDLLHSMGFDTDGVYGDERQLEVHLHHFDSPKGQYHRPILFVDEDHIYIVPQGEESQGDEPYLIYTAGGAGGGSLLDFIRGAMSDWDNWTWHSGDPSDYGVRRP